jgi:hypothetical protein
VITWTKKPCSKNSKKIPKDTGELSFSKKKDLSENSVLAVNSSGH